MVPSMLFVVAVVILHMSYSQILEAQLLQVGFYNNTCNCAETIVRQEVQNAFHDDEGIAAGLIRLHFHDCFVRGCDGSILIDSRRNNVAEKDGAPNGNTLRGLQVIDKAKTRLEATCKGVVSCADILAFAARDATVITGGFRWDVPAGRRDGRVSLAAETVDIPAPTLNLTEATELFEKKGLTQEEMIILLGSHTIGRAHCTSFSERLYNFNSTMRQDPSLNPFFAAFLRWSCPQGPTGAIDPNAVVQMNISPNLYENSYYRDVLGHRVVFTSDQTLTSSTESLSKVREYASNDTDWQIDFADAMLKLSKIGVLTGSDGEIRSNCRVINP